MEIYLSEKFNCKGTKDLREFLWADYKKGLWDGEYLSDQLKLQTSKHGMRALPTMQPVNEASFLTINPGNYKLDWH